MTTEADQSRELCAGCGCTTILANISALPIRFVPARSPKDTVYFAGVKTQVRVCPDCGRVEFFAQDLNAFA